MNKFKFSINFDSKNIDKEKGEIKAVSIISEGEAKGHGVLIDKDTIAGLYELVKGKTVKSYLKHDFGDRITDEAGLFSAFFIDGDRLRGTFSALKAFRSHEAKAFDSLFELAETAPEAFGVSISFSGYLVFFEDGEEKRYTGEEDADELFVRVTELHSIDWVGEPAANATGVFSAKPAATEDESEVTPEPEPEVNPLQAELDAEKEKVAELSAKITELETANAELCAKAETVTGKLATVETEKAELQSINDELSTKAETVTDLETKVAELEAEKAELAAKTEEAERKYFEIKQSGNDVITLDAEEDLIEKYHSIKDTKKRLQFFREHKSQLLG